MKVGVVGSGLVGATVAYTLVMKGIGREIVLVDKVARHHWGHATERFRHHAGCGFSYAVRNEIDQKVRRAAYSIISGKAATYYGIGSALARIVDAVLHDQRSFLTVSSPTRNIADVADVTVALPRLVGGAGVIETFPLPLSELEHSQLRSSAGVIRQALDELAHTEVNS